MPILDNYGSIREFVSVRHDITQLELLRCMLEEKLFESYEEIKALNDELSKVKK